MRDATKQSVQLAHSLVVITTSRLNACTCNSTDAVRLDVADGADLSNDTINRLVYIDVAVVGADNFAVRALLHRTVLGII